VRGAGFRQLCRWGSSTPRSMRTKRRSRAFTPPRALIDEGLLAYGFHGPSYEYIAGVLRQ
jgi:acetate kinase